ncbi:hypothetical protein EGW08_020318 [Elysia chlorotica]|uniref:Uncharacterized protein n=1 Tax=Elysia chlorotica TaxID=188477 RepID=A0A433SRQ6_ELYCH|nr:hypothetical protein EGW08_020318 [Elysia chlorotica]
MSEAQRNNIEPKQSSNKSNGAKQSKAIDSKGTKRKESQQKKSIASNPDSVSSEASKNSVDPKRSLETASELSIAKRTSIESISRSDKFEQNLLATNETIIEPTQATPASSTHKLALSELDLVPTTKCIPLDPLPSKKSLTSSNSSDLFLRPLYVLDKSKCVGSFGAGKDHLKSSANNTVAMKNAQKGTDKRKILGTEEKLEIWATPRLRGSKVSNITWDSELSGPKRKKPFLLAKDVDRYVNKAPFMYDRHFAFSSDTAKGAMKTYRKSIGALTRSSLMQRPSTMLPTLVGVPSAAPTSSMQLFQKESREGSRIKLKVDMTPKTSKTEQAEDRCSFKVKITTGLSTVVCAEPRKPCKFDNFSPNLVPVTVDQKARSDEDVKQPPEDQLFYTSETSHIAPVDVTAQGRQPYLEGRSNQHCRSSFRTQRIPVLRKSPAHILKPIPTGYIAPPNYCPTLSDSSTPASSVSSAGSKDSVTRSTLSKSTSSESGDYLLDGYGRSTISRPRSVRIDQHGLGAPRFYPWAPFNPQLVSAVRCYVMRAATAPPLPHQQAKTAGFVLSDTFISEGETDFESLLEGSRSSFGKKKPNMMSRAKRLSKKQTLV